MIDALIAFAAELPDPGQPSFPNVCGAFGGFVGMAIAVSRGLDWDRTTKLTAQGGAIGYGVGVALWSAAIAIDRL